MYVLTRVCAFAVQPQEGWTALMYAASYDDEDCVKLLLAHPDIAVNQQDVRQGHGSGDACCAKTWGILIVG